LKRLLAVSLTLAVLFCGTFFVPTHNAAVTGGVEASNVRQDYPDLINVIPLFEENAEENIYTIPAGTRWKWSGWPSCCSPYYVPYGEPPTHEAYSGIADYPDCFFLRPDDPLFPPNNPEIFELAD
jgi:hypothetical protein